MRHGFPVQHENGPLSLLKHGCQSRGRAILAPLTAAAARTDAQSVGVQTGAHFLARLEIGDPLSGHVNRIASARVAALARIAGAR
jgi:hypothetical protein